MSVVGGDGAVGGKVKDVWVDRSEPQIRYLEVETSGGAGRALVPIAFAKVNAQAGRVEVQSIFGKHFAGVPQLASPDQVSLLEEDRISAYYAGGTLYSSADRLGPLL
jgi:photosynthetic reaction center H subunit